MGAKLQVNDFKNGNFADLRASISRVSFEIAALDDIDEYWDKWKALFLSAVKDHIPTDQNSTRHQLSTLD